MVSWAVPEVGGGGDEGRKYINVITVTDLGLAILAFGEHVAPADERGWPMHEVEVKVVGVEVFQRGITGLLDVVGVMGVVPQLGGEEDVFSRDTTLLDACGARRLCPVALERSVW